MKIKKRDRERSKKFQRPWCSFESRKNTCFNAAELVTSKSLISLLRSFITLAIACFIVPSYPRGREFNERTCLICSS